MSQKDFAYCIFYIAKLRANYLWTKPNAKTKFRKRTMTEDEILTTQKQLDDLKIDIKL